MIEKKPGRPDWSTHTSATLRLISLESWDSPDGGNKSWWQVTHKTLDHEAYLPARHPDPVGQLTQVPGSNIRSRAAVEGKCGLCPAERRQMGGAVPVASKAIEGVSAKHCRSSIWLC